MTGSDCPMHPPNPHGTFPARYTVTYFGSLAVPTACSPKSRLVGYTGGAAWALATTGDASNAEATVRRPTTKLFRLMVTPLPSPRGFPRAKALSLDLCSHWKLW